MNNLVGKVRAVWGIESVVINENGFNCRLAHLMVRTFIHIKNIPMCM